MLLQTMGSRSSVSFLTEPYRPSTRAYQANQLWQQVHRLTTRPPPGAGEPHKLARLKTQLLRDGKAKLFTCLIHNSLCDNNRAELDLRQLVLMRKRCFGSKTQKGAKAFSTILSVCTTTWRSNPEGYFKAMAQLW